MWGSGTVTISDEHKHCILIFILAVILLLLVFYLIGRIYNRPVDDEN